MYLRKQLDFSAQWQMTHIFISPGYGTSLVTQFCLLIEEHPGTSQDWKGLQTLVCSLRSSGTGHEFRFLIVLLQLKGVESPEGPIAV